MAQPRLGKQTFTGNLDGKPPVERTNHSTGKKFVTFRILDNQRKYNENNKSWENNGSVAYDVAINNEHLSKNVLASFPKGNERVTVTGDYRPDAWSQNRDGKTITGISHKVYADSVSADLQFASVDVKPQHPHKT